MSSPTFEFYEFFAGGGMARLGLGERWRCAFANEWCEKKAHSYRANFRPSNELLVEDICNLTISNLPGRATLSWASFPCQDLSLAGNGDGLAGNRSGTFWPFWQLMTEMKREGRAAPIIALENVTGAITSNGGGDFRAILNAFVSQGYRPGALVINASHFVPQSRPRLFIVATLESIEIPRSLHSPTPQEPWHTRAIRNAHEKFPDSIRDAWVWWNLPLPAEPPQPLASVVEENPVGVAWHTEKETERLLSQMADLHRDRVRAAQKSGERIVGTIYKRTRVDDQGKKAQRAETRFDNISGCLRTPAGGSSRQTLIVIEGPSVRTRLISPREAARLMGVGEQYELPENYNQAYRLMGDAVAPPAVAWLERHLLFPIAEAASRRKIAS